MLKGNLDPCDFFIWLYNLTAITNEPLELGT